MYVSCILQICQIWQMELRMTSDNKIKIRLKMLITK